MSISLSTLRDNLSIRMNDYLHSETTTAVATGTNVVDTALANAWGGWNRDTWQNWYTLFTSQNNTGAQRFVANSWSTGNTNFDVRGTNLATDSGSGATYEFHRFDPEDKKRSLNIAARKVYPVLFRNEHNQTLITGNILPQSHFDDWLTTATMQFYSNAEAGNSGVLLQTSTAGLYRGGSYSCKFTAAAADDYFSITSSMYPRLLDLQGASVDMYCWVYPEVANDAEIEIYTLQADGTAQTLTSTTDAPAGYWTLISLKDQELNDDLTYISIRFRAETNAKYVIFDNARLLGRGVIDYMLPTTLQSGRLNWVRKQYTGGNDEQPCDDIGFDDQFTDYFGWQLVWESIAGTLYKFLRTPEYLTAGYLLEIEGVRPLEDDLSADTDTLTLDTKYEELYLAYAELELYKIMRAKVSADSSVKYDQEIARLNAEMPRLESRLRMMMPASQAREKIG